MEALFNSWTPGITGGHLPVHVVPRCYEKSSSSRRKGVFQPPTPSLSAIRKKARSSIFLVEEAPGCKFLPHIEIDRSLGTSSAKRRLRKTTTRLPSALSRQQEDHQERLDNSAQLSPGSFFCQIALFISSGKHGTQLNARDSQVTLTPSFHWRNAKGLILRSTKLSRLEADEPLKMAEFIDTLGTSLAEEDKKSLLGLTVGLSRGTDKKKVEHIHNQKDRRRRSVLNIFLPTVLETLGFQFSPQIFLRRQSKVFARSLDSRTSTRETNTASMGRMRRESIEQVGLGRRISHPRAFRCGRVKSHFYTSSGGPLRAISRVPVPAQSGASRRLWSRAHSGGETAGNLFTDLLTTIGLVVVVVFGTYAFAKSRKYFKSDLWSKKNPFETMTSFARPAKQINPKPPNLSRTKIVEITDENFYDTIQKRFNYVCGIVTPDSVNLLTIRPHLFSRPTFVLFHTDWCPYCQKLDPTWIELGNILSSKGYDIQLARMNPEKHPIAAQNLKVVKYPTLIFFKGETDMENYLGPRTVNSLMKFIDEKLPKNG